MWLLSACMGTVLRWVCLMIPILGTNTGIEEIGGSPRRWRDLRRGRRRSRRGYRSRASSRASQASNVGERNWTSVWRRLGCPRDSNKSKLWPSSPGRPASRRSARRRRYGVQEVRRRRGRRDGSGNGILAAACGPADRKAAAAAAGEEAKEKLGRLCCDKGKWRWCWAGLGWAGLHWRQE